MSSSLHQISFQSNAKRTEWILKKYDFLHHSSHNAIPKWSLFRRNTNFFRQCQNLCHLSWSRFLTFTVIYNRIAEINIHKIDCVRKCAGKYYYWFGNEVEFSRRSIVVNCKCLLTVWFSTINLLMFCFISLSVIIFYFFRFFF